MPASSVLIFKKLGTYFSKTAFFISAAFMLLLLTINISALFNIFLNGTDVLKNYPFGTETGLGYHSADEYYALIQVWSYFMVLTLLSGGLLYILKKPMFGALVMAFSVCFFFHIGFEYGKR